jgi:plastocyanin
VRRMILSAVAVVCCLTLTAAAFAAGSANRLTGTDGPGFTITMSKKTVKAGTYKIVIRDRSSIHNFHLTGPGVNKKTSVAAVGTTTWTLKLKKGTYKFVCDPHASIMRGVLRVT